MADKALEAFSFNSGYPVDINHAGKIAIYLLVTSWSGKSPIIYLYL